MPAQSSAIIGCAGVAELAAAWSAPAPCSCTGLCCGTKCNTFKGQPCDCSCSPAANKPLLLLFVPGSLLHSSSILRPSRSGVTRSSVDSCTPTRHTTAVQAAPGHNRACRWQCQQHQGSMHQSPQVFNDVSAGARTDSISMTMTNPDLRGGSLMMHLSIICVCVCCM